MNTIGDTGLVIKHLTVADWATVIEDINHNFAQLLGSPLFKGTKGDAGNSGNDGEDGERGVKWFYVDVPAWQAQFPDITAGAQITQNYVNTRLTQNPVAVLAATGTDRFVDKDIMVLPNQLIMSYNSTTGQFDLTGASFANNGVTTGQVQAMINSAIGGLNIGAKLLRMYDALAKNYIDGGTGGQNNALNPDSILDIATSDSGPGYNMGSTVKYFGMDETTLPTESDWSTIFGTSPKKYHSLVQATQNGVGQTTNEYGPGASDPATLILMQASRNNSMILGWKGENTLRNFSRIYRNENGLVLTSNYSAYQNEYGEIIIEQTKIDLRAPIVNVKQELQVMDVATFQGAIVANDDVTISLIQTADILATDNTGKIVRGMSIERAGLSGSPTAVPNSQVVKNEIIRLEQLIASLTGSTGADLTEVLARIAALEQKSLQFVDPLITNFNTQTNRGIRITNVNELGAALPANQFGYLITYKHPTNENFLMQFYKSTAYLAFRTAILSGGVWTFGAWVKLATQAQIDTINTAITNLNTALTNQRADILTNGITVDDVYIKKQNTGTPVSSTMIYHFNPTVTSTPITSTTYETRTPTTIEATTTIQSGHVTGKNVWTVDRGLFAQAGFIQWFHYPLLMPFSATYATIYNKFFFANGRGKLVPPEFNATLNGMTPTIDLRHFVIADGRNNSPELGGIGLMGAGSRRLYGINTGTGSNTYYLGDPKTTDEAGIFKPGMIHGQFAVTLGANEGPIHTHPYTDTVVLENEAAYYQGGQKGDILIEKPWRNWGFGLRGATFDWDNARYYVNSETGPAGGGSTTAHQTMQPTMAVFALWYVGPTA